MLCFDFAILLNPFPNKPWLLHVCSTSFLKTLWENEKLLVSRAQQGETNPNFAKTARNKVIITTLVE